MKRPPIIAMALLLLATAALAAPAPAAADQNDSRLDALFTRLLESPGPVEAQQVEGRIWQTWMQSDDGAVPGLSRDGVAAMARGGCLPSTPKPGTGSGRERAGPYA